MSEPIKFDIDSEIVFPPVCCYCCLPASKLVKIKISGGHYSGVTRKVYNGTETTYHYLTQTDHVPYCRTHKKAIDIYKGLDVVSTIIYILLALAIVYSILTYVPWEKKNYILISGLALFLFMLVRQVTVLSIMPKFKMFDCFLAPGMKRGTPGLESSGAATNEVELSLSNPNYRKIFLEMNPHLSEKK